LGCSHSTTISPAAATALDSTALASYNDAMEMGEFKDEHQRIAPEIVSAETVIQRNLSSPAGLDDAC